MNFRNKHNLLHRKNLFQSINKQYPDRIPIIIDTSDRSKLIIRKNKYIVPKDLLFSDFLINIRKYIEKLNGKDAIFIFFGNVSPSITDTLGNIYEKYKDKEDSFLYGKIIEESTFG
jgi:GABA(A) receptor-associated protein